MVSNHRQAVSGEERARQKQHRGRFCAGQSNIQGESASQTLPSSTKYQHSSLAQSCLTLCDPMEGSTPGLPVHHHLPELAHTHVHPVGDAIQPSRRLSSPLPPAFSLSIS